MNETSIEWTDLSNNPIKGCTDATYKDGTPRRGCLHCYARRIAARLAANPTQPKYRGLALFDEYKAPKWTNELRLDEEELDKLRRLTQPRRIMIESMGDIAHEAVPVEWYLKIFEALIDAQPIGHAFYLLSKRPWRQAELLRAAQKHFGADRYWRVMRQAVVMTTLEDRKAVADFLPDLLATDASRLGVSAEPLAQGISLYEAMGPFSEIVRDRALLVGMKDPAVRAWFAPRLRLAEATRLHDDPRLADEARLKTPWLLPDEEDAALEESCEARLKQMDKSQRTLARYLEQRIDGALFLRLVRLAWVITGGESGNEAQPSHPDWFRNLRNQCEMFGVPFHFKQWGAWGPVADVYADGSDGEPDAPALMQQLAGRHRVALEPDGSIPQEEFADGGHRCDYQPCPGSYWMVNRPKRDNGRLLDGRAHDGDPGIVGGYCHAEN